MSKKGLTIVGLIVAGLVFIYMTCNEDQQLFTSVAGLFSVMIAILVFFYSIFNENSIVVRSIKTIKT